MLLRCLASRVVELFGALVCVLFCVSFCVLFSGPVIADKLIKLTSLEWPPYTGPTLPAGGHSTAIVKAAFAAVGYQLEIEFLPWERAVVLARQPGSGYAGYFPEYYAADISREFLYSVPIGNSPLGLVQHKSAPLTWNHLDDLLTMRIGVVRGYVNTAAFDANVAAGIQAVESVGSDEQNLKKVATRRIPAAIIDQHVMQYLLANSPTLAHLRNELEFNENVLENKQLFVCFRKGPHAEEYALALAEGLRRIAITAPNMAPHTTPNGALPQQQ